ncbi:MAG: PspC domain-containing protein [Chloroflexi bacterium]|nr:PspC domain-containing protein [Chloroflexota bacterium]
MEPKRLYRSTRDRKIWGVCGGLAEYFNVDPVLMRVIFVALAFAWGVGILLYIVLALLTPSISPAPPHYGAPPGGSGGAAGSPMPPAPAPAGPQRPSSAALVIGVALIVIGAIILVANLGGIRWIGWGVIGPVILIVLGILLFLGRRR